MKVYPENKNKNKQKQKKQKQKNDLCVISIENQFLASFLMDPALYYATPRHITLSIMIIHNTFQSP